jgi:UDP-N-acetylglucosamine--N-acetylmuramyl-(pentapeptide) pyrophosphoryl-undecaprenol N-acetylglucosamine transferase
MTGGGVYPALAVLQALQNEVEELLWIGSDSGMEASLLSDYQINYKAIPAAGLHGVGILSIPGNLSKLIQGWFQSKKMIRQFKPDAAFFTGGFISVPVALATGKTPNVFFIPDVEPGLALKSVISTASNIAVVNEKSTQFFTGKKVSITGYPLRQDIRGWEKLTGRKEFGLPRNAKVLLVFGGSKGSRSINQALLNILPRLLKRIHVIHLTGADQWEVVQSMIPNLDSKVNDRYHPFPFLKKRIGAAFAAADLVVCRAGASTLGELPFFGLPAILIPYPHAWKYQYQNAEELVESGGAVILRDEELDSLYKQVEDLISDDLILKKMGKRMASISKPNAAEKIASIVSQAAKSKQKERENG